MLRESSVPYSSLPQEENEQAYVTTRSSGPANTPNKVRILAILILLLILLGVPLLIIFPIAISKGWNFNDVFTEFGDNDVDATTINTDQGTPQPPPYTLLPPYRTTTINNIPDPTTTTTTTPTTTTTTTTTTTPMPIITTMRTTVVKPEIVSPTHFVPVVETSVGEVGKNQSGNGSGYNIPDSEKGDEGGSLSGSSGEGSDGGDDKDRISFTTTQNFSNMMNNFMSKHEWWTLVGLAVAATVALSAVIITIAFIIKTCIASRQRKTDLNKVITDLQSRDKVILLNSEDSDEEA